MRRRRLLGVVVLLGLGVVVLTVTVSAPADVGRWAPVALDGTALNAVAVAGDGSLVVGGPAGAWQLADARVIDLELDAAVEDLLAHEDHVLAATDVGVLELREPGDHTEVALAGVAVDALVEHRDRALAVAEGGLHDVAAGRPIVDPGAGVRGATSVDDTLLLALDDGVGEPDGNGGVAQRWQGAPVDRLLAVADSEGPRLLAAVPAADGRLLASSGAAGPWEPSDDGIRLATVQALAEHPDGEGLVLAGGTGLDDGDSGERGGIADSADAGRSWTNERDRLSTVHVYDFATRDESLRAEIQLAGRDLGSLALPVTRPHTYAATNGGGLYRRQPELPGARLVAALEPVGRFLAPAALGTLVLLVGWGAFLRLAGSSRPTHRPQRHRAATRGSKRHRSRPHRSADEGGTGAELPTSVPAMPRWPEPPETGPTAWS